MRGNRPCVSIGMPVYNGEAFIEEALDSILAQSFDDFELIIADNASIDSTEEICRAYAVRDSRVRYYRNQENVGAALNYNRVFELSRGKYFKWAAHDDVLEADFLAKCVEVMESDPSIVLCHSRVRLIDEKSSILEADYNDEKSVLNYHRHVDKCYGYIIRSSWAWVRIFGLIRSDLLAQTPLIQPYVASDVSLLAELALRGRVYEVPENLFLRRGHAKTSCAGEFSPRRRRVAWFAQAKQKYTGFPEWRLHTELLKVVFRVRMGFRDRLLCLAQLGTRFWHKRKALTQDVYLATKDTLRLGLDSLSPSSRNNIRPFVHTLTQAERWLAHKIGIDESQLR